jgi:hypothetical protein
MNSSVEQLAIPNPKMQKALSLVTIAIGIALLCFMISVEGELGAIPLLTFIAGMVWHFVTQMRYRRALSKARSLNTDTPTV